MPGVCASAAAQTPEKITAVSVRNVVFIGEMPEQFPLHVGARLTQAGDTQ
jgi:hypothetical protein